MIKLAKGEHEAIQGVINSGGFYTIEIDADDIPLSPEDEKIPYIAENLITGFQHAPSTIVQDPKTALEVLRHMDTWGRMQVLIAHVGGKITYRKLPNGRFEAKVERAKA
jgi:hypothetical protein